jgi:hypothetical protein
MGLFICDICNYQTGILDPTIHICDLQKVKEYNLKLQKDARDAELELDNIRNAILNLIRSVPSMNEVRDGMPDNILINSKVVRDLWDAAECRWYEQDNADIFLSRWLMTHQVLCEAFDVFRSDTHGNKTKLEKLQALKKVCVEAAQGLGYDDESLDLSPEDVIKNENTNS